LDCPVDGPPDCWRPRQRDDLGALAALPQHAVAVLLAEVGDVRGGGSKVRKPRSPSMATNAKSQGSADF
jgi:hypothetical protein